MNLWWWRFTPSNRQVIDKQSDRTQIRSPDLCAAGSQRSLLRHRKNERKDKTRPIPEVSTQCRKPEKNF